MFDDNHQPLFPFYWTSDPRVIKGAHYESLDDFERESVAYLETLCIMRVNDLLEVEGRIELLTDYVGKYFGFLLFD
jgi:hypothetical protein